jgi:hypothetical protein
MIRIIYRILIVSLLLVSSGCYSIEADRVVEIKRSGVPGLPYVVKLHIQEKGNFNVHKIAPESWSGEFDLWILLKKRIGLLVPGEFSISDAGPDAKGADIKGTIEVTRDVMTIDVKFDESRGLGVKKYTALRYVNGTYTILNRHKERGDE